MGYELRRQLRNVLGPDITGLQRAVALEIADDANDETRASAAPMDDLVRWTGAKDASVVRNALKRLAAAGWEFRVAIGKGGDGRVLYAVPGRRVTYRVPHFEGGATATPWTQQGGAGAHSEGATATPSGSKGEQGLPLGGAGATPSDGTSEGDESAGQPANSTPRTEGKGGAGATPSSEQGGAVATPSSSRSEEEEEVLLRQGGAPAPPSDGERDYAWRTFGKFWTCYPRSKDIGKTRAAWREALDGGADPDHLVAAAINYAHECKNTEARFIKYPANWLREGRYHDQPDPEPARNGQPSKNPNDMTEEEKQDALKF